MACNLRSEMCALSLSVMSGALNGKRLILVRPCIAALENVETCDFDVCFRHLRGKETCRVITLQDITLQKWPEFVKICG